MEEVERTADVLLGPYREEEYQAWVAAGATVRENWILALRGVAFQECPIPPPRPPKRQRGRDKENGGELSDGSSSGPVQEGKEDEEEEGEVPGGPGDVSGQSSAPSGSESPLRVPPICTAPPAASPPGSLPGGIVCPHPPLNVVVIASGVPKGPPLHAFLHGPLPDSESDNEETPFSPSNVRLPAFHLSLLLWAS